MKLTKQSKLFFKEGNSDKVYEIDLCEMGNAQYTVNFRYGRRGATLKEGTKTEKPVSLVSAEQIFDTLEAEKRKKGYQSEQEMFQSLPPLSDEILKDTTLDNAIIKRLNGFLTGENPYKSQWKISRVVWKAGELRLKDALPFIIRLTDRGDEMQRYAALWAMGRIADSSAEHTLNVYASNQKYTEKTRRIANESLIHILKGNALKIHLKTYFDKLPQEIQVAIHNAEQLNIILTNLLKRDLDDYEFIEDLYSLSIDNQIIKKEIVQILYSIPLKARTFKPIRHIYKIAELRDDFEIMGLLAYRFEQTQEMFKMPLLYSVRYQSNDGKEYNAYVPAIRQSLKIKTELKKKTSRLAYSDRTKTYLTKKSLRHLKELGQQGQNDYIKLAVSILLSYNAKTDYKAPYSNTEYKYYNDYRNWEQIRKSFPAYSNAVLLNYILYGGGTRLKLSGEIWVNTEVEILRSNRNQDGTWNRYNSSNNSSSALPIQQEEDKGILNRVFDSVFGLFSKQSQPKAEEPIIEQQEEITQEPIVEKDTILEKKIDREEVFPELWDNMPQAYIQLLLKAKVEEIHTFAYKNLSKHSKFQEIKDKIDFPLIEQLLSSEYQSTALFGLELVKEKLANIYNKQIILALIGSPLQEARHLAFSYIEKDLNSYFEESTFVTQLLFSKYTDVRTWTKNIFEQRNISEIQQQILLGRSLAQVSLYEDNSTDNNAIIADVSEILLKYCSDAISNINNSILLDLLKSPIESIQVLAVKIIILKNAKPSTELLCTLLVSPFAQVRKVGGELLTDISQDFTSNSPIAISLVHSLTPNLLKKEPYEGLHQDIAQILCNHLKDYLAVIDNTTALRLIHANYRPAQDVGLVLLKNHIDAQKWTLRNIITLGNHELLVYRQWCWEYFTKNIDRIKYERDEAIRLLDAKWDDSRAFAIQFFRNNFDTDDWSSEALIGIADSVRPDIEAFGRELITRFFDENQGEIYLLKLSQHPSLNVQLFASNYLERYAVDNPDKLANLTYYFRSVLTRVNKGRSSKNRIFNFLYQEACKSANAAHIVADILRDVSATASIEDKAKCISIMRELQSLFGDLQFPIKKLEFEER